MIQPVTFTPNMDANTMTAAINDALRQINDNLKNVSATDITVDTINEKTEGHGVTIDGLLVKDGFAENMARDYYYGNTTHLNDIIKSGMYGIYSRPESPFGNILCALQVNEYSPDWIVQVIWGINSSNSAPMQRMRHSGTTWTNWKQLSTVEDIGGEWKSWNANPQGFSSITRANCFYTSIGKTILMSINIIGVSNSDAMTFQLPVAAARGQVMLCRMINAIEADVGIVETTTGSRTATCWPSVTSTIFTAGSLKGIYGGSTFSYESV